MSDFSVRNNSTMQVDATTAVGSTTNTSATSNTSSVDMPKAVATSLSELTSVPTLDAPQGQLSMGMVKTLSDDAIMTMLGMEQRDNAVKDGKESIKAHKEERAKINEEKIKNLEEQAAKAEELKKLSKISKIFKYIGIALQAVSAAVTIAVAVVCPNPLTIAGAALVCAATTESILSSCSDGKLSLANGFAKAAEATGGNEKAARIAGTVTSLAIGLTGAIMSGCGALKVVSGAGDAANAASKAGTAAMNAQRVASTTQKITSGVDVATQAVAGGVKVGEGATQILTANATYDADALRAESKKFQALLMRIQAAQDMDQRILEKALEVSQDSVEGVKNIVDDCVSTVQAVTTGAPAMA